MLVMSRHPGEAIVIGEEISLQVVSISDKTVHLRLDGVPLEEAITLHSESGFPLMHDQEIRHLHQKRFFAGLALKKNQTLEIGDRIAVVVVEVRDAKVRLGTEVPPGMSIRRGEVA